MERPTPTAIVRVHRPELTAEERAKRMEAIKDAAARLIVAAARGEGKHEARGIHR